MYTTPTHPYNWSAPSCYSSTAAFNNFYSELMPYTALANCYGVSAYDAYQFQGLHPLMITTTVAM